MYDTAWWGEQHRLSDSTKGGQHAYPRAVDLNSAEGAEPLAERSPACASTGAERHPASAGHRWLAAAGPRATFCSARNRQQAGVADK